MATVLGSLLVSLGLNSGEFDRGLDKARRNLRTAGKDFDTQGARMERLGFRIGRSIRTIAAATVAIGIGLVTRELSHLIRSGLDYASSLEEQAEQLGVTTDQLQEYRYAASQVGITTEQLDKGLAFLTRTLGELQQGAKAPNDALERLGFTQKQMAEIAAKGAGGAIPMLADALAKIKDPAEKAAIAADLFGAKLGGKFLTLMHGGSQAINNLRDAAHEFGIVLSEQQIQNADATADKLGRLKMVLQARIAGVIADNAEAIGRLADSLANLIDKALKAAGAWLQFRAATSTQNEQFARADAYLAGRRDLTAAQRATAQTRARQIIDQRLNLRTETTSVLGGLIKIRRTRMTPGSQPKPQPRQPDKPLDVVTPIPLSGSGGGGSKRSKGGGGKSGPTAAEIESRFNDELAGYTQQTLSAMSQMAGSAEEAAELELRGVEISRIRTLDSIQNEEDFSSVQKQRLSEQVEELASQERSRIDFDKRRRLEQEASDVARQTYEGERDQLQTQASMADTDEERQRIALELLELDQEFKRNELQRIIYSDTRNEVEKALAQQALNQLNANAEMERRATIRQSETRVQAYLREINKTPGQINEAIDEIKISGLERLNDELVDALVNFKSLGEVARSVLRQILADLLRLQIQKAIISPLASFLGLGASALGGFGGLPMTMGAAMGGINSTLASVVPYIPFSGLASGGPVHIGKTYLVGENGPELFTADNSGEIISNSELQNMKSNTEIHSPTFIFPGIANSREAKEAAGQAARRYRREISGPVRQNI